jgi:hypothetical protein
MPSELEQMEEYAALFLTIDEIAILLDTNAEDLAS